MEGGATVVDGDTVHFFSDRCWFDLGIDENRKVLKAKCRVDESTSVYKMKDKGTMNEDLTLRRLAQSLPVRVWVHNVHSTACAYVCRLVSPSFFA